jgi:hypothetical protein
LKIDYIDKISETADDGSCQVLVYSLMHNPQSKGDHLQLICLTQKNGRIAKITI